MIQLTREEVVESINRSDLFRDLFEELLPAAEARRYREVLEGARVWRLQPGESLPNPADRLGAYAVLSGYATADSPLTAGQAPEDARPARPRRVFGQWTGLRGLPMEEKVVAAAPPASVEETEETEAAGPCDLMECDLDILTLLLADLESRFKVEFYFPLVAGLKPIADAPEDTLEMVIRRSRFSLFSHGVPIVRRGDPGNTMFFILVGSAVALLDGNQTSPFFRGDFFGEIAVITYQPRTATVRSDGGCLVMESQRDPVAQLQKKSPTFKALMDECYRERAMLNQLRASPLFQGMKEKELEEIRAVGTLETFEPYEPVFFQGDEAGDEAELLLIVNGTLNVVEETPQGPLPVAWARPGDTIGEIALLPEVSQTNRRGQTVTALQRVDAISIRRKDLIPILGRYADARRVLEETVRSRQAQRGTRAADPQRAHRLAWMMETEYVAGNEVLAVDMENCIRCNNCVTACQSVHDDGLNRFFWGAMRQDEDVMPKVRFSNSCQHCEFALCMRVCPKQCIERGPKGEVYIDYDRCIRCGKCADPSQGCAYGSIYIVPTDEVDEDASAPFLVKLLQMFKKPAPAAEEANGKKESAGKKYPVKCDLCHGLSYQACAEHCPTGAVFRVDGERQFAAALERPASAGPGANRPPAESRPVSVNAVYVPGGTGRGELEVTLGREGPGEQFWLRQPEDGFSRLKLNFRLDAPEPIRVTGGGPLQQLILPAARPEARVSFPMNCRGGGEYRLVLSLFQGGLYLGRVTVPVNFGAATAARR